MLVVSGLDIRGSSNGSPTAQCGTVTGRRGETVEVGARHAPFPRSQLESQLDHRHLRGLPGGRTSWGNRPAAAWHGSGGGTGDAAEIANWNAIAASTLVGDTSKQGVETFLYMGFVQAAVYNAVVGVEGGYKPYDFHAKAPHGTSSQAAAVAAAHKVLVTYSPYAESSLDAAYATSLAAIPDGWAKDAGVQFGTLAADTLIQQRSNDGRNAPVFFTTPPGPGIWRPTPPPFLPCPPRGSAR